MLTTKVAASNSSARPGPESATSTPATAGPPTEPTENVSPRRALACWRRSGRPGLRQQAGERRREERVGDAVTPSRGAARCAAARLAADQQHAGDDLGHEPNERREPISIRRRSCAVGEHARRQATAAERDRLRRRRRGRPAAAIRRRRAPRTAARRTMMRSPTTDSTCPAKSRRNCGLSRRTSGIGRRRVTARASCRVPQRRMGDIDQRDYAGRCRPFRAPAALLLVRAARLDLLLQRAHHVGVAQRRDVAERAALGDVAQQPAHDLARARLGQVVGPDDPLGPRELADARRRRARAARRRARRRPRGRPRASRTRRSTGRCPRRPGR